MGMDTHSGPRRRRVGNVADGFITTIRMTPMARRLVELMRQPGVILADGCSLGDVIEVALCALHEDGMPELAMNLAPIEPTGQGSREHLTLEITSEAFGFLQRMAEDGYAYGHIIDMALAELYDDVRKRGAEKSDDERDVVG